MPLREDDEHAEDFRALAELAEVFTALVAKLTQGDDRGLTPEGIVDLAARSMPRAQHVALVVDVGGTLRTLAASSDVPDVVARIRQETGEGPAFDVVETNDVVVSGDLGGDPRWPEFGRRTVEETGMVSVATYRLYVTSHHRAALSFYSDWPYAFDDIAVSTGAIFAAYASLATLHLVVLDEPVGRVRPADVHREIGVAIGILVAGSGLSAGSAYRRLHEASRTLRRSLPETARHVIEHGHLP
jgi:hypothetical protein